MGVAAVPENQVEVVKKTLKEIKPRTRLGDGAGMVYLG
jgi:hypothetical protein